MVVWQYAGILLCFELALGVFRPFDWNQGIVRAALLALLLMVFFALGSLRVHLSGQWKRHVVIGIIGLAALWDVSLATMAIGRTARTGDIPLDQGQNTYRAALGLWKGTNPYGQGALLDLYAYRTRMAQRAAAGLGPTLPHARLESALTKYWRTLQPDLLRMLLPTVPPGGSASARLEASILGYKYGPIPVMAAALLVPLLGAIAVPLTNALACMGLFAIIALILKQSRTSVTAGGLALAAVMIDPWVGFSYLWSSASDIWVLLFGFAAVLSAINRRAVLLGLCLALAIASKTFPALLYVPLLLYCRSWRAVATFIAVTVTLFAPYLTDARGLFTNIILWPAVIAPDSTSWIYYATPNTALLIRVALAGTIGLLLSRLITGKQWAWSFTMLNLCAAAAAPAFHNNYIPWFSTWGVIALTERLT
jgi:hypothetical protein